MYKKPSAARGIKQAYEHLLSANLRDKVPPWLHAMRSTPPADSLVRDPSLFSTHGKLEFENQALSQSGTAQQTRIKRTLPPGCVSIHHKKAYLRSKSNKPPKIEFPEDRLRKEFYRNHPFERYRPRSLVETTGKNPQTWNKLSDGTSQITGENVIRYQYYLMQTKGMSKQDAYIQATDEFYAIRAREEMNAKIAYQEACFYGAQKLKKPFSAMQLVQEDIEIRKSAGAFEARDEEQRMRETLTEKMFTANEE